ncbi:MAG: hypothetical protein KAT62_02450 [Desulfuromonadales bacterium]|nr:hypothetical protein [Desulfuromonadales bacterium]
MEGTQLDIQLCSQCGGRCCQGHPGVWSDPQRFFAIFAAAEIPTADEFSALLDKHRLTLRDLGGILIPAPRTTEQGCAEQRPDGCAFTLTERPCQCLALIPNLETLLDDLIHCTLPPAYGSGTARENWRPYQTLLQEVQALTTVDSIDLR